MCVRAFLLFLGCRQAHPITAKLCADFQSILIVLLCAGEIPVQRASSLRSLRLERSFKYVAGRHVYAICHLSNAGLKVTHLISLRMRLRGDRSTARSRRPFFFTSPCRSRLTFNFGSTLRGALKHTTHSALTMQLQQVPDEADERCATRLRLRQQSLGRPTIGQQGSRSVGFWKTVPWTVNQHQPAPTSHDAGDAHCFKKIIIKNARWNACRYVVVRR
jgi:hypothetical protein